MSNPSDHLMVVIFLSSIMFIIIGLMALVFFPIIRSQKKQTLRMNQLEVKIKTMQDKPQVRQEDDLYMDALEKEFQHSKRRNTGKKRR